MKQYQINKETEEAARAVVSRCGIPKRMYGWQYLSMAVALVASMPENERKGRIVTKVIYPCVAEQCGSTGPRVERAIRTSVEYAWDMTDDDSYFHKLLDVVVSVHICKPVNSDAIYELAYEVERMLEEQA